LKLLLRILCWIIIIAIIFWAFRFFIDSNPTTDIVDIVVGAIVSIAVETMKLISEQVSKTKAEKLPDDQIKKLSQYIYKNPIKDLCVDGPFLSYRYTGIKLYGRKKESRMLDDFMYCNKKKCIWSIAGHGGMGKSKLAFHMGLAYSTRGFMSKWWKLFEKWNVIWVDRKEIKKLLELEFDKSRKPVLVICDYAGSYSEDIAKLLEKLFNSQKRLRVLLLERTPYVDNDSENWFAKLKRHDNYPSRLAEFYSKNKQINQQSLNLNEMQLAEKDYRRILDNLAAAKEKKLTDAEKNEIITYFQEKLCRNQNASTRCLFLLLAGDAALENNEYKNLDAESLVYHFIERLSRDWEHSLNEDIRSEAKQSALQLLALATAGGKFGFSTSYKDIRATYCDRVNEALNLGDNPNRVRKQFFAALCEGSGDEITPLYPDIIGELFVVSRYCIDDQNYPADDWFPLLFSPDCSDHFEDFLKRLCTDWYGNKKAQTFFADAKEWAEKNGTNNNKLLIARVYHDVGLMLYHMLDSDAAIAQYNEAILLKIAAGGEKSPSLAATYNNLGVAYDDNGDYDEAIEQYEKALDIYEIHPAYKAHPETATTYNNLGIAYRKKGEYDKAIELYKKALGIKEQVYGKTHPETARTYNNLGDAYRNKGVYDKAIEQFEKALDIYEIHPAYKAHPETAGTYNNLGAAYGAKGKYDKAIELYKKALGIYENHPAYKAHPETATTYNNLGAAYWNKGEYDQAIEQFEKALDIYEIHPAYKARPETAATYNNLGAAYDDKGEYDKAIEQFEKALGIYENHPAYKAHPETAATYNNLGAAYRKKGEYDQAIGLYKKALGIYENHPAYKAHPETAKTYNNLGAAYGAKGDYDEAIEQFEKALGIYENHPAYKAHPETAKTYNNLGVTYIRNKEYYDAIDWLQKALDIYENNPEYKNRPDIAMVYYNFADVYKQLKNFPLARTFITQALAIFLEKCGEEHPYTQETLDLQEEIERLSSLPPEE